MASKEAEMLDAAVPLLQAIPPTRTPDGVYQVDAPQLKHFGEHDRVMLVHPGDVIITEDTTCQILYEGDFLVTAGAKHQLPELPWEAAYAPTFQEKLALVEDVKDALNGKELAGVMVFLAGRNLDLEIDGWSVVQVQLSYRYNEVTG
jgi:hypothetical protein